MAQAHRRSPVVDTEYHNRIAESRNADPVSDSRRWAFLTNHAQVLLCVAGDPDIRLRDIGEAVGITERAANRIVGELAADGYLSRERHGRRNRYRVNARRPLPDSVARSQKVGDLLEVLTGTGR